MLVIIFDEVALGRRLSVCGLRKVGSMFTERTGELPSAGFFLKRMIERRMLDVEIWTGCIPRAGVSRVHK